jgi:hypothetical protein
MAIVIKNYTELLRSWLCISTIGLLISSCQNPQNTQYQNQSEPLTTHTAFDEILLSTDTITIKTLEQWQQNYPYFLDLYLRKIIHLPPSDSALLVSNLNHFTHDSDIKDIYNRTQKIYTANEKKKIFSDIESFLASYQHELGNQSVKHLVTFISAFNYAIITTDSVIGVGLDMYLGNNCEFYPSIGIPSYAYRRFSGAYILNDVIKGWFQSEYDVDDVKNELLSKMIYYGKQWYFTDIMAPQLNDTIKTGYSLQQLEWCNKNSKEMWAFLIENKLLYSSREMEYMKFIADGNTTQGFPEGAPARTAQWLGWQIVKAYMKNNAVSLKNLLEEKDAQLILEKSGFKP